MGRQTLPTATAGRTAADAIRGGSVGGRAAHLAGKMRRDVLLDRIAGQIRDPDAEATARTLTSNLRVDGITLQSGSSVS